jgi:hypothetical protein
MHGKRRKRAVLWVVATLVIASSWYPFAIELPTRVANSAVRRADGSWLLDRGSRVVSEAPAGADQILVENDFTLTVRATPAMGEQSGPARLVSIQQHPYDSGLMIGVDRGNVVVYLPCAGAVPSESAEWSVPLDATQHSVSVALRFRRLDGQRDASVKVNAQPGVRLDNRCPAGTAPTAIDNAATPWTLGNVRSGHRPFVGVIDSLELSSADGRQIDVLKTSIWQVPSDFWLLPERLYQTRSDSVLAAIWHIVSFALLGYLLIDSYRDHRAAQLLMAVIAFAAMVNAGKLLFAERHPALIDAVLNASAAAAAICAHRYYLARAVAARHRSARHPDVR